MRRKPRARGRSSPCTLHHGLGASDRLPDDTLVGAVLPLTSAAARQEASMGGRWLLLYAWSGSPGVDAVATALVLATSRRSVSAASNDRTDPSASCECAPMARSRVGRLRLGESCSLAMACPRPRPGCRCIYGRFASGTQYNSFDRAVLLHSDRPRPRPLAGLSGFHARGSATLGSRSAENGSLELSRRR